MAEAYLEDEAQTQYELYRDEKTQLDIESVDPEVYAEHFGDVEEPFDFVEAEITIEQIIYNNIMGQHAPKIIGALHRNHICNVHRYWRGVTRGDLHLIRKHVSASDYDSFLNHVEIRCAALLTVQEVERLYAQCAPPLDLTAITAWDIHKRDLSIEEQLRNSFVKAEELALEKYRISVRGNVDEMQYFNYLNDKNTTWNGRTLYGRLNNWFLMKLTPHMYNALLLSLVDCNLLADYLERKFETV